MDDLKKQVMELAPDAWEEFIGWVVGPERDRRNALPAVEAAEAEIMAEVWEAQPDLKPAYVGTVDSETPTLDALLAQLPPWVQPTNKTTAYPHASLVKHKGKAQRNRRRGLNSAEPGTPFSGWEDVTADLLKPVPVQDGNAEDADTTDAPGLITEPEPETPKQPEPEPEVTPADTVPPYKDGEKLARGETRRYTDGKVYVWQKNKLEATKPETAPDKNTGHWLHLG